MSGDVSFRRPAVDLLVVTMHIPAESKFRREVLAEAQFDEFWAEILPGRDCPPVVECTPLLSIEHGVLAIFVSSSKLQVALRGGPAGNPS